MKKFWLLALMFAGFDCLAFAQADEKDYCHVYLVDEGAAKKFLAQHSKNPQIPNEEQAGRLLWEGKKFGGVTILGRFQPEAGEEVLTTRHYSLPGTKQIVTASVYYTDESMFASKLKVQDSVLLGLAVAAKGEKSAFESLHGAVLESSYTDDIDTLRVKTRLNIGRTAHVLGLECRFGRTYDEDDPDAKKP